MIEKARWSNNWVLGEVVSIERNVVLPVIVESAPQ